MSDNDRMSSDRRCTATSKQTGKRCGRIAHPGASVCTHHGAGAPQVQAKAKERLLAMVDPALDGLMRALRSDDHKAIVAAARAVLDRAGFPSTSRLEHEQIEQAERAITEGQSRSIARVVRATLNLLGLAGDHPAVREAFRAALEAEREGRQPPRRLEGVTAIPPAAAKMLDRWWSGEVPPLAMLEASVENDDEEATR